MNLMSEFTIPGEYYLNGVPEMASGFKLNNDKTFGFFMSYGALDRFGNGKWNLVDNKVTFNSIKWSGQDFRIVKSDIVNSDKLIFELGETNPGLFPYIYVSLHQGEQDSWRNFDSHGSLVFEKQAFKSVSLALEFCPERFTTLNLNHETGNYFLIKPEPSLFEYYFDNFSLMVQKDGFMGKHPMMDDRDFFYSKNK